MLIFQAELFEKSATCLNYNHLFDCKGRLVRPPTLLKVEMMAL